mmetsp:Transcript_33798/g.49672  ORF Transcript_33798/g.49672 Transcript_33798/m.49672 type:complete len:323 (+) Transcript_33798:68-1036(+)|eukprot:CAMPEP_0195520646 /NCGR_PEP_ID=MMETSP0794_2-20130614/17376_1 /TAXON_ID=515487 /ORGANISM="Stephanopyxis turris, Strain CCMP 815" /LENGTH=322 /DNA_ID=CAMNT_0040650057 /DNA_START=53 /DNA_END=1021 /DNA_ORIENTATION=+
MASPFLSRKILFVGTIGFFSLHGSSSFTPSQLSHRHSSGYRVSSGIPSVTTSAIAISTSDHNGEAPNHTPDDIPQLFKGFVLASALAVSVVTGGPSAAFADEYGKETEAPTLYTGETTEICVKRGPLGACKKVEERTEANDNDKAAKYMKLPSDTVKEKDVAMRMSGDEGEGSELIKKLRQQSLDNRDKNDLIVRQKTIQNNQAASFGPFDRQTVIMNIDGESYTLLENPQAMRLKKAGYIKDRKFVVQPSQKVIDDALESPEFSVKGLFGFGDNEETVESADAFVAREKTEAGAREKADAEAAAVAAASEKADIVSETTAN